MKTKLLLSAVMLTITPIVNALDVTDTVKKIGTSWDPEAACVYLTSGHIFKIDLNTQKGKAELSIALSANAQDKELYVHFDETKPLVGGCNNGTIVKSHGVIILQ